MSSPRRPRSTPQDAFRALATVQRRGQMMNVAFMAANKMVAQEAQWGTRDRPDEVNLEGDQDRALDARLVTASQERLTGDVSWRILLEEEVAKAFASRSPEELAARLVDVMALAGSWYMRLEDRSAARPAGE